MRNAVIDPITLEVLRNRLEAIAQEMQDALVRSAYSNIIKEGHDCSAALFDARGRVTSTEGSWRAGRRGARAGIVMPAHPHAGDTFAQERFPGHAEDSFRVLGRVEVTVPHGTYRHALRTREWTPLEPGVVDHKFYVRGLGLVAERSARGPHERAELIAVTHSP